jgi:hypothetical protein
MPSCGLRLQLILTLLVVSATITPLRGQEKPSTIPVRMTVTASVPADKRMPEITPADVLVKQGKDRLPVG